MTSTDIELWAVSQMQWRSDLLKGLSCLKSSLIASRNEIGSYQEVAGRLIIQVGASSSSWDGLSYCKN